MLSTPTRTLLLLCTVALASTPASAEPARHQGQLIGERHLVLTDVSAVRKKRHVARRHVRRGHPRSVRIRHRGALQQVAQPALDRFGVGYQNGPAASPVVPSAVRVQRDTPRLPTAAASSFGSALGSSLIAEARRYIGTNPTGRARLWCGHFMNLVLQRTGRPVSPSNTALSFASYGRRISGPQIGAIAVMARGRRGGHVGIVSGIDPNGNPIIISGNHGGRVAETVYPRGRIFAYVMP